jgi:hypothetical protein
MTRRGIARIPEDRHVEGLIADMSVTENVIAELYREERFSRRGFLDWRAAEGFARDIIVKFDVKCPSPAARVRLLSGGNMQKLILGRTLSLTPASSSPASRRAGSISAPSPMCMSIWSRLANEALRCCSFPTISTRY